MAPAWPGQYINRDLRQQMLDIVIYASHIVIYASLGFPLDIVIYASLGFPSPFSLFAVSSVIDWICDSDGMYGLTVTSHVWLLPFPWSEWRLQCYKLHCLSGWWWPWVTQPLVYIASCTVCLDGGGHGWLSHWCTLQDPAGFQSSNNDFPMHTKLWTFFIFSNMLSTWFAVQSWRVLILKICVCLTHLCDQTYMQEHHYETCYLKSWTCFKNSLELNQILIQCVWFQHFMNHWTFGNQDILSHPVPDCLAECKESGCLLFVSCNHADIGDILPQKGTHVFLSCIVVVVCSHHSPHPQPPVFRKADIDMPFNNYHYLFLLLFLAQQ